MAGRSIGKVWQREKGESLLVVSLFVCVSLLSLIDTKRQFPLPIKGLMAKWSTTIGPQIKISLRRSILDKLPGISPFVELSDQ
jgi:hypothetical protein